MDPKKLSQLDPKLRDAYQRVMGTKIPQPQAPASVSPQAPTAQPQPIAKPQPEASSMPEAGSKSMPFIKQQPAINPNPQPALNQKPTIPVQPPTQSSNFTQMNSEVPAAPAAANANFAVPASSPQAQSMAIKKKKGIMLPILFGIVGLIFIAIYTLFWTKIFNLKLPFLP